MAYTSTDLSNIQTAIRALESGERAVSVSFGDKQFKYSEVNLDLLYRRETEIKRALRRASGRGSYVLTQTSKGL